MGETRRVLRPGGRVAIAAWDGPEGNPWATIPTSALVELGHVSPPDPSAPGMFTLSAPGRLADLLEGAGFTEPTVDGVDFEANYESLAAYLEEQRDLSRQFGDLVDGLTEVDRDALRTRGRRARGALRLGERRFVAVTGAVARRRRKRLTRARPDPVALGPRILRPTAGMKVAVHGERLRARLVLWGVRGPSSSRNRDAE